MFSFIFLSLTFIFSQVGCGIGSNCCSSFVRESKLEDIKAKKIGVDGKDIYIKDFGAGTIELWGPHEIPPSWRTPNEPYVGKYKMYIYFSGKPYYEKLPSNFRLLRVAFTNLNPPEEVKYLSGRYYQPQIKQYAEFTHPNEIIGKLIDGNKGVNGIDFIIDLSRALKSFDLEVTVEVSYQDKTEIVNFKDRFVRSKYYPITID